jgi:hypothetical protein
MDDHLVNLMISIMPDKWFLYKDDELLEKIINKGIPSFLLLQAYYLDKYTHKEYLIKHAEIDAMRILWKSLS